MYLRNFRQPTCIELCYIVMCNTKSFYYKILYYCPKNLYNPIVKSLDTLWLGCSDFGISLSFIFDDLKSNTQTAQKKNSLSKSLLEQTTLDNFALYQYNKKKEKDYFTKIYFLLRIQRQIPETARKWSLPYLENSE